jgi:hypothetical protein
MILGAPPGMPNCDNLPATMMVDENDGSVIIASFWQPTVEELAALNAGKPVTLFIFGKHHPPVAISVEGCNA